MDRRSDRPKFAIVTLDTLVVQERKLYVSAEKRLGPPYLMARQAVLLLTMFIESVSHDRFAFVSFMAILKKHMTLALLSVVRRHHVEGMMNFRQVIETASNAAYALAHPAETFVDQDTGIARGSSAIRDKSFGWVGREFPKHSADLKAAKDRINESDSHSNIAQSSRLVGFEAEGDVFGTAFFDEEDPYMTTSDLVELTHGALCVMHLLDAVRAKHGGMVVRADWYQQAKAVYDECERIKASAKGTERFKSAMEVSSRVDAAKAARKAKAGKQERTEKSKKGPPASLVTKPPAATESD